MCKQCTSINGAGGFCCVPVVVNKVAIDSGIIHVAEYVVVDFFSLLCLHVGWRCPLFIEVSSLHSLPPLFPPPTPPPPPFLPPGAANTALYVHSPVGLFPCPLGPTTGFSVAEEICSKFRFLGKFIAKAIMDSRMVIVWLVVTVCYLVVSMFCLIVVYSSR